MLHLTKNNIQTFEHDNFSRIHATIIDGNPYFVAGPFVKALGYEKFKDTIFKHCKNVAEHIFVAKDDEHQIKFISEKDARVLIVKSEHPSIDEFERWFSNDILPSLKQKASELVEVEKNTSNEIVKIF